jgi:pimeloyl-ACP methyl ester carboxylesterase
MGKTGAERCAGEETLPFFYNDGLRLFYEVTGSGEQTVIWLHEFAADYRTWEAQVRYFSRDYRCVTVNARGYPPSDVPEGGSDYTYEKQRDDVLALMNHLGVETAHIVGLSMGAYTGLQFALAYPERTASLVFCSGGSGATSANREAFVKDTEAGAKRMLQEGMLAAANGLALGATRIQLLNKDPRGWTEFRDYMAEHSALGSALTLMNSQAVRPSLYDLQMPLSRLDVPVLLAVGDEDDPVIEVNVYLKRVLPRAGLWIEPRSGHGLNLEEPDAFNRRVADFLCAVQRGAWGARDPRASAGRSVFMGDLAQNVVI